MDKTRDKESDKDDRIVIEVKEPARGKALLTTRRMAILPKHYVKIELECDELQGKFEIKPELFLHQKEPNLWMDNFVVYNVPEDKGEVNLNEEKKPQDHSTNGNKDSREISEESTSEIPDETTKGEVRKVLLLKGQVVALAEKESNEENEVFKVEEIMSQEGYRNWILKRKGVLPIQPKSDFICSPAEVSKHGKEKLKSKPIGQDTAEKFEEL